ncbi:MAG: hypothetical protein EOO11_16135 [Chitinophagaceae bacterium]|nr:MAG: hypothetical protein EOO11_16135 [Chitinophagaceae bacterium]
MKKLFSLLLCAGLFSSAFAQTDRERARDILLGKGGSTSTGTTTKSAPRDVVLGGNSGTRRSTGNACQDQINAINRSYDNQVRAIQSNPLLSSADKSNKIRQTNEARRYKIAEVRRSCDTGGDGRNYDDRNYDDRNYSKKNKVKGNNGNHYGWEKGVGNPHRTGGKAAKGHGKHKHKNK